MNEVIQGPDGSQVVPVDPVTLDNQEEFAVTDQGVTVEDAGEVSFTPTNEPTELVVMPDQEVVANPGDSIDAPDNADQPVS